MNVRSAYRRRGPSAAVPIALALGLLVGCGRGGSTASDDGSADALGPASSVVQQSEVYSVANLNEVAALSTLAIEGDVISIKRGPTARNGPDSIGFLEVTIKPERIFLGQAPDTVSVLVTGFHPKTGEVQRVEGIEELREGTSGIWYLRPTDADYAPDSFFVTTSAGQILREADGTADTGGSQQAASVACGKRWSEAEDLVEQSISRRGGTEVVQPGVPSKHLRPDYAGNPCSDAHHGKEESHGD